LVEVFPWQDVTPEPVDDAPGVTIRWAVDQRRGAPRFALRVFEVAAGSATPLHRHWYEQEMFILAGAGEVVGEGGTTPLTPGDVVFVRPDELHQFRNTGSETLRFICVVPLPERKSEGEERSAS
jgi:quercetin dioxygenase-like cupin family protein